MVNAGLSKYEGASSNPACEQRCRRCVSYQTLDCRVSYAGKMKQTFDCGVSNGRKRKQTLDCRVSNVGVRKTTSQFGVSNVGCK